VKKTILNDIIPIFERIGDRSGWDMKDRVMETRKLYWERLEQAALANGTRKNTTPKPLDPAWYPVEWAAFVQYGPPAGSRRASMFNIQRSNGPASVPAEIVSPPLSRKEQRKLGREEYYNEAATKRSRIDSAAILSATAVERRRDRVEELKMLVDLADNDEERAEAKKILKEFLKSPLASMSEVQQTPSSVASSSHTPSMTGSLMGDYDARSDDE
jgi:hypothetical protein